MSCFATSEKMFVLNGGGVAKKQQGYPLRETPSTKRNIMRKLPPSTQQNSTFRQWQEYNSSVSARPDTQANPLGTGAPTNGADQMSTTKTPQEQHAEQVAMLQVWTTEQKPAEGQESVIARTRNGKNEDGSKREVSTENRLRCIVIPELAVDGIPSKFQSLVMGALRDLAVAQLSSIWKKESQVREVPAAIWTVDSLLLFAAREAESQRLTTATIGDWFDSSNLAKRIMLRQDPKLLTKVRANVVSLAAPALTLLPDACATMRDMIAKDRRLRQAIRGRGRDSCGSVSAPCTNSHSTLAGNCAASLARTSKLCEFCACW
jgi:hypothetical protein